MEIDSGENSIERALAILEFLGAERTQSSHARISRALGIPKSTASHILGCLTRRGYVRRQGGKGAYSLGKAVLALVRHVQRQPIEVEAGSLLEMMVSKVKLASHLSFLEGNRAVYVACKDGPGPIKVEIWEGLQVPLHASAVGKALISGLSEQELDARLGKGPLPRFTTRTLTARDTIAGELKRIRAQGHAVDDEESAVGVRAVAAPVRSRDGTVRAALGVIGTTIQVTPATLPILAGHVRSAARKLAEMEV